MCSLAQNLIHVLDTVSPRARKDCAESVFNHCGGHAHLLQASSKNCPSPPAPIYLSAYFWFLSRSILLVLTDLMWIPSDANFISEFAGAENPQLSTPPEILLWSVIDISRHSLVICRSHVGLFPSNTGVHEPQLTLGTAQNKGAIC